MVAAFGVADAAGRSASQAAEEADAQVGFSIEPSSLTIAGVEAIVLGGVPPQATVRQVFIVYEDRLYTLTFVLPSSEEARKPPSDSIGPSTPSSARSRSCPSSRPRQASPPAIRAGDRRSSPTSKTATSSRGRKPRVRAGPSSTRPT
jgi:hypothetical protein